jgi:chromosome partitioning protein
MGSMNNRSFFEILDNFIITGEKIISLSEDIVASNPIQRYYKLKEVADMCNVSSTAISNAEKKGRIPAPTKIGSKRLGHTVSDLRAILEEFDAAPKQKSDPTVTISFATLKGGSWKTTTAFNASCYLASKGYRVLVVDLDPQATMSMLFGMEPDKRTTGDQTLGPYITGQPDYDIERFRREVIQPTRLKGAVDIIPSCTEMQLVESLLTNELVEARIKGDHNGVINTFFRLQDIIDEVKNDYDVVIMDGTPSLGILPINIIAASDVSIIPAPTAVNDFCSTIAYLRLLSDYLGSVIDISEDEIAMPMLKVMPTKFSAAQSTTKVSKWWLSKIRETFGNYCTQSVIKKHDAVIDNCSSYHCSIFETQPGDLGIKKEARDRALQNFTSVFDEMMEDCVYPLWPSKVAEWQAEGKISGDML